MSQPKEEKFNLATPGDYTITHREGAPEREPRALAYDGRIDAPRAFIDPKKENYDPKRATVTIDTDAGTLSLKLGEKDHDVDTIGGKLEADTKLTSLGINGTTRYTPRNLFDKLKRLGQLFPERNAYVELLGKLNRFTATVKKTYEDTAEKNGASKKAVETIVEGFEPITFMLDAPLFKGGERHTFGVEICIDASTGEVQLYLDSTDLEDVDYKVRRALMTAEAKYFEDWGASVLFKS